METRIYTIEEAWEQRDSDRFFARAVAQGHSTAGNGDLLAGVYANIVLAYLDFRERAYERATKHALEALAILETHTQDLWLPRLFGVLASIHFELGERDTCRIYLDQQIRLSNQLGDTTCEALGYHDLGLLQAAVDRSQGLKTLAQAQAMFRQHGDSVYEALALYNIANIHEHAREHELALSNAQQACNVLDMTHAEGISKYIRIHIATLQAEIATHCGRETEAGELLKQAYEIAAETCPELLAHIYFCEGLNYVKLGNDAAALLKFQAALSHLGPAGQYELLLDCHAALADCYERQGEYRRALEHHRVYAATRERTFLETSEQKVRALDVIHRVTVERQTVEAERQRNRELQHYVDELEQLQSALWNLSVRDPLTDLHNRRYLTEEGARLLRYAQQYQTGLCAVMIDVDHFKQINDTFGHQIGDRVLQEVAQLLTSTARRSDLVARYGGEEFTLLFGAASINDCYAICERLRLSVALYDWSSIAPALQVTVSIGLAADQGYTLPELLSLADAQLYIAKRSGRNQTSYQRE